MEVRTNRRRLELVGSSLGKRISNNAVLKATVIGFRESVTKAVSEEIDPSERYTVSTAKNLLRPPFPLDFLTRKSENSNQLGPCIEVMEVNIEGFGL